MCLASAASAVSGIYVNIFVICDNSYVYDLSIVINEGTSTQQITSLVVITLIVPLSLNPIRSTNW